MRVSEKHIGRFWQAQGMAAAGGDSMTYRVVSQEVILEDDEGQPAGSMFTYSYLRSDTEDSTRPVIFAYNGGPGSASFWLHAGFFGPQRLVLDLAPGASPTPPYAVENNPNCLLDTFDIVLIDPVGTGYGELLNPKAGGLFYGVDQDARAFALVIEHWLNSHERWNAPKFLCGESYGTLRSAALTEALMGGTSTGMFTGIAVNGIILIGNILHVGTHYEARYIEPSVQNFISYAATRWYHSQEELPALDAFVKDAYAFSVGPYAHALLLGDYLPNRERDTVLDDLVYYTGLPRKYLMDNHLRVDKTYFLNNLLQERGLAVGAYDSRLTLPLSEQYGQAGTFDDPAMAYFTPVFTGAFHDHFKKALGIDLERAYNITNMEANMNWDWASAKTPSQYLSGSMRRNPALRVMFATGLYDLCTVAGDTRYIISQIGLPLDRVERYEYASGHMAYVGDAPAAQLAGDIRGFVARCLGQT